LSAETEFGKIVSYPCFQRVLTSSQGSFDQDKTKVTDEIIAKFQTLDVLLEDMSMEWKNSREEHSSV
jgi:hypothetical protein